MTAETCEVLCLDLPLAERLRRERLDPDLAADAAETAKVLGDPTRLTIAAALSRVEELCVCDLAWIVERSQSLVSHHLAALRRAGLVRSRRDGKMVMYALTERGRHLLEQLTATGLRA